MIRGHLPRASDPVLRNSRWLSHCDSPPVFRPVKDADRANEKPLQLSTHEGSIPRDCSVLSGTRSNVRLFLVEKLPWKSNFRLQSLPRARFPSLLETKSHNAIRLRPRFPRVDKHNNLYVGSKTNMICRVV